ncbi:MAG: hypothetical protein RL258_1657 [Pseudomonadota bacterium]
MSRRAFLGRLVRCSGWSLACVFLGSRAAQALGSESAPSPTETPVASLTLGDAHLTRNPEGQWVLSGNVNVSLSLALVAAIERGVTLQFESVFRAQRRHFFWFRENVYEHRRVALLTFHPITRLFRVRLDGSAPQTFIDLTEALRHCLVVRGWQVAPAEQNFEGLDLSLRLRLDKTALPKPLQISAFTTSDWNLSTGWVPVVSASGAAQLPASTGQGLS